MLKPISKNAAKVKAVVPSCPIQGEKSTKTTLHDLSTDYLGALLDMERRLCRAGLARRGAFARQCDK